MSHSMRIINGQRSKLKILYLELRSHRKMEEMGGVLGTLMEGIGHSGDGWGVRVMNIWKVELKVLLTLGAWAMAQW